MQPSPTVILVGTTKGAFLLHGDETRGSWRVSGPHCDGAPVNHFASNPEDGTIWAGGGGDWDGACLWTSRDGGATWARRQLTSGSRDEWAANDPEFAEMIGWREGPLPFGKEFSQIWSLSYAHGTLLMGTKPAGLLRSADQGANWDKVSGLTDHPSAGDWNPGAAGLILHTIVRHPSDAQKTWVGISAAGVFATEDGGASWERRNRLANAAACEGHDHPAAPSGGETGHCVHNMMRAPGDADVLYQQNHHGVWRSGDGGRSWEDLTEGLPSTFGFPIRVHPRDPQKIWTIPLNGDSAGRFPPGAAAAVWHSCDGGQTWAAQREGLPQEACFFTVLRQAMAGDACDPAGLYFGTNTGSVFATRDEGNNWEEIARHLPTILCVETL
ncbi:MAG: exo-alpha-sialidase [Pseudomonadota bacterium]